MRSTTRHDRHHLPCRSLSGTILLSYVLLALHAVACAEQVELTTYYPAPFGVYDTLVAEKFVDYNDGSYHVPPSAADWFVDPSAEGDVNSVSALLRGRVGIGTAAPARKLQIVGTGSGSNAAYVRVSSPDEQAGIEFLSNDTGPVALYAPAGSDDVRIGLGGTDRVTVTADGQMGIGTTSPVNTLHVAGGGQVDDILVVNRVGAVGAQPAIEFHSNGALLGALSAFTDSGGGGVRLFHTQSATGAASLEGLRLAANGRVGIGTAAPAARLDVAVPGEGILALRLWSGPNGFLDIWPRLFSGGRYQTVLGTVNDRDVIFQLGPVGNMGVGSADPKHRLSIWHTSANAWTSNGWGGAIDLPNGSAMGWRPNAAGWSYGIGQTNGGLHFFQSASGPATTAFPAYYRLTIADNGNVGVHTTAPAYTLEVNGSAGKPGGGSWSDSSDARLKTSIAPLTGALDRLLQLRGVTYEWQAPEQHGNLRGPQIGMIAQDVEPIFPAWVGTDNRGFKTLTFRGFEALTVESLRTLRTENTVLRQQVEALTERVRRLERSQDVSHASPE